MGDTISEGQTVMLIEAMKTYNPVRATKSGKVVQILVEDSTPVEFGEELLLSNSVSIGSGPATQCSRKS